MDDQVDQFIKQLGEQQRSILRFYSEVSADILQERVEKMKNYALIINKSVYWADYFEIKADKENTPHFGEVFCRNENVDYIDESLTGTFRHFVSANFVASDYFTTTKDKELSQFEKDVSFFDFNSV